MNVYRSLSRGLNGREGEKGKDSEG
jgi:hypothetical protein